MLKQKQPELRKNKQNHIIDKRKSIAFLNNYIIKEKERKTNSKMSSCASCE